MFVVEADVRRPRGNDVALQTELVTSEDRFDSLQSQWNAVAGAIPFRRWEWSRAWWTHCRPAKSELALVAIYDPDCGLVGLAPLYASYSRTRGRVLRFLGSGPACSDYLTLLATPDYENEVTAVLSRWAVGVSSEWDIIELDGVSRGDTMVHNFAVGLQQQDFWIQTKSLESCWSINLAADWDAHVKGLSKPARKRMRRLQRQRVDTSSVRVHRARSKRDVARGLEMFWDFYRRQHAADEQRAAFATGHMASFLLEVAHGFHATGDLLLSWIECDGTPIAVAFDLAGDRTAYSYQSAYAPEAAHVSPGWISLIATSQQLAAEGFTSYDLLRGDEQYKQSWGASAHPMVQLRIVSPRNSSRVRHMLSAAGEGGRSWLKQKLSRVRSLTKSASHGK